MSNWRPLLLRLGDRCPEYGGNTNYKEHIETCFSVLWRELENSSSHKEVLDYMMECAQNLPHKMPFYGTLIGLLNLENEGFVQNVLEVIQTNFQDAFHSGNCGRIRTLMRFLTVLMCSKVLQPASLVVLFETFLSSAATTIDEETGNPAWQARADFYVTCILSSLPWGAAELIEQAPEEIERVMVGIEAYLSIRKRSYDVGFSIIHDSENAHAEKDFLEDLWDRIKALSNSGWIADSVPRPHLSFEAQLIGGKCYDFGPISCPEQSKPSSRHSEITYGKQKHEAELKFPRRLRRLNIFPSNKIEDLQPIDRFIVEEYLLDVLLYLNGCRKECASYMVGLPVPFRYEHLMAETIFSQLLLLPQPPFKPIYYTIVIIDLCKALPGAFPSVVAGAVRTLFERISEMDMECRMRLVLWFSHHLSNFQFIWPWEEWAYVLKLPKWAPQRVFVQEVLEREVRLSYWDKIKQGRRTSVASKLLLRKSGPYHIIQRIGNNAYEFDIPGARSKCYCFHLETHFAEKYGDKQLVEGTLSIHDNAPELEELLPPKVGANFKYKSEDGRERTEEHTLSLELSSMVKGKMTAREIIAWTEEKIIPVHGFKIALEVVIQTLLEIGSKTFTHLITVLERYGQVIAKLCPDHEKQIMLIEEVGSYWKNSAQMTAVTIDRMMGYRLISNIAIVTFVFSRANINQFHTSDRSWEIVKNAVNKTYNRISDLRKEILVLQKGVLSAELSVAKAKAELEAAEKNLSLLDGEPVVGENPLKLKRLKSSVERAQEEEVSARDSLEAKDALLARALDENESDFPVHGMALILFAIARKKSNATMADSLTKSSTMFDELVKTLGSRGFLPPPLKATFGPTIVLPSPVESTQNPANGRNLTYRNWDRKGRRFENLNRGNLQTLGWREPRIRNLHRGPMGPPDWSFGCYGRRQRSPNPHKCMSQKGESTKSIDRNAENFHQSPMATPEKSYVR
ncbi:hypothetical protein GIB67_015179 [Kingdonia uniflora]|uniref:Nuclear cap-binding protein subunit 1 n=1 Tax=Kingdonia uniflora TaxID=39325 RepID=A0A7J7LJ88_9MAGN|nr:hypothetical protein GIB67_015179 [Kingdonia uniflora]